MKEFFTEMWSGDWLEKVLMSFLGLCVLALVVICGYGIFCASDSWYVDDADGTAVVICHSYRAPYTSFAPVGKVMIPQHHPARWALVMEVAGRNDDFSVKRSDYNRIPDGSHIRVRYRKGRFSNWIYITEAWL